MNTTNHHAWVHKGLYRLCLLTRHIGTQRQCRAFGTDSCFDRKLIEAIHVINLDRQVRRRRQILGELRRMHNRTGARLSDMITWCRAVDSRQLPDLADERWRDLQCVYSLADQFFVDPNPLVPEDQLQENRHVQMSRPEVAVAMSHIGVWRMIANAEQMYTLVLEDDVVLCRQFSQSIEAAWDEVRAGTLSEPRFDVLYLSYREAKHRSQCRDAAKPFFRPVPGLWQLSGYVLSKRGAKRLLDLLPLRGPVDLWVNQQFDRLEVLATCAPLIEQRLDNGSDNSYSILPVLAKVGALDDEKQALFEAGCLATPVFAMGNKGTGMTALAVALSMLGYRCCSDIDKLPKEVDIFSRRKSRRMFDAFVNVGTLDGLNIVQFAKVHRSGRFIILVSDEEHVRSCYCQSASRSNQGRCGPGWDGEACYFCIAKELRLRGARVLVMPSAAEDKWRLICGFLGARYPANPYPVCEELGRRRLVSETARVSSSELPTTTGLKSDVSPWILPVRSNWRGFRFEGDREMLAEESSRTAAANLPLVELESWMGLNDTFPGNKGLFRSANITIAPDGVGRLCVQKEFVGVRSYTAAAVMSRKSYHYGRFTAIVRPSRVSGLITGVFLHRNTPRQEIDIEFLGRDTTKMLVNVFYNPGCEGTKFDYGYRGTPYLVDLGFDAADEFHQYSIEWRPMALRWFVDGRLVHERAHWAPTPVPQLQMRFYVNHWPCRSEELAGRLADEELPAYSEFRLAAAQ